jgi:hypothetical protein
MTDSLIALAVGAGMLVVWWRMSEARARQVASRWFPNRSLGAGAIMVLAVGVIMMIDAAHADGWVSGGVPEAVAALIGLGGLTIGLLGVLSTGIFWRPRWLLPPKLRVALQAPAPPSAASPVHERQGLRGIWERLRGSRRGPAGRTGHRVTVMFVDPPDGGYEPYYVALCDQDDLGPDPRSTAEQAFADARRHSSNVDPDVVLPLGQR